LNQNRNARSVCLCVGLGAIAVCCAAAADEGRGWYAGANLGMVLPSTQYLNGQGYQIQNSWNSGFYGSIVGGYRFANGWRPELEFAYRNTSIGTMSEIGPYYTTTGTSDVSGYESATTLMGNIWYDYRASDGFFSVLHPYGGVGVGIANVNLQNESFMNPGNAGFIQNGPIANGSGSALAYQLGFGASMDLLVNLEASIDFRYLFTTSAKFDNETFGGKWSGTYRVPSIGFGFKYHFGASED
jgi:hypothetical protein